MMNCLLWTLKRWAGWVLGLGLGLVPGEALLKRSHHLALVLLVHHVDEVDDDDPAKISEAQLSGDTHCRLEVGPVYRFFEIAVTHIAAGIHVDGCHRFGLIKNYVTA